MARFTDKVAVVTGAGRGIGLEIARAFAAEGGKVAVVSRSAGSCGAAADAINVDYPGAAKAYAVDVSDHEAVQTLGKEIVADFGAVNILVNNAGVTRDGLLMRMKEKKIHRQGHALADSLRDFQGEQKKKERFSICSANYCYQLETSI